MLASNPFAELSALIPPAVMQAYVVLMVLLVIGGTLLDVTHKKSAKYFFAKGQSLKKLAKREVNSAEKISIALGTVANEVLASGEFENPDRRKSHLLLMYGFIIFVVTTALQIFALPAAEGETSTFLPLLWHLGALMVCIGGYWFWFKIRVDVRAEGHAWYDVHLSDLFIVSLLLTTTFALVWSLLNSTIALVIFIAAATTLFSSVFWSKFAHMFYKPAAAFQKKVAKADGSRDRLPDLPELTDPAVKARYPDIPEYMGDTPPYMGLGIKREAPNHY
ncbi:adenylyl-sulfate reductase [Thiorhodococcus mannitoliphagus]|uniref:Adenylyl-sulfate reductase n=1 Tax=Thiorhodococcus mannitoliphagus TaxID=329406 RepID=A0A6P1DYT0_9GAMM|nr:adenylyl-sulfate reductase [Thiorhodococcus mannitoliphagus]NEX21876.1 adenylyl-sulfate reductase [Thiorhodococcus mannitoliphagus]